MHPDEAKGNRAIAVPLNSEALRILKKREKTHPIYVFSYRGNSITQVNTKAWKNALKRAGITNFRWHDLRHYV